MDHFGQQSSILAQTLICPKGGEMRLDATNTTMPEASTTKGG